jgi:purine-nucleoside phosphorylase
MSIHISAEPGQIAETVLISGDPLRIKFMAERFLTDVICFNEVRGMYGYTGFYKGKRVSMMGTGMGIPSTALYVHELAVDYQVKNIIRVGTAGATIPELEIGNIILAITAGTDSSFNKIAFNGQDFSPCANYELLEKAVNACREKGIQPHVGPVFTTDRFYSDDNNRLKPCLDHGIIGIEMETAVIYTLAARHHLKALSILSVSDNLITGAFSSSTVRERSFEDMFEIALDIIPNA